MWHYFPENYSWSYQIIRILGQTLYDGGEVNEILEVARRIKQGDYDSFHQEWIRLGNRTLMKANEAMDQENFETARAAYLRAANYIRTAEFYLQPGDARKIDTYLKGIDSFRTGAAMYGDNRIKPVQIPYEESSLPGYLFKASSQSKGPLVIMFGGLDSTAEELYFGPAQLLNERGISLLALDGPGQGGALRLKHIRTRYDYEVAGTAAYEWAIKNLDVDPERIGIMAISMGGYMVARIAAYETRFKACGIFGACYSYHEIWNKRPDDHPMANTLKHVVGVDNMNDAREKLSHFHLNGVAAKIKIPTYVLHGEDDRQVPVEDAYKTYNELSGPRWLKVVPTSSPGSAHCQADNFTESYSLFDWMKQQLNS